jgi:cell division transport system ATP-binding protein
MEQTEKVISIKNGKIVHKEHLVLKDINLEINKGDFVYLIGKTGSGKSSLLKVLYGDHKLDEGEGSIAGYDLKKIKRKQIPFLRRKIGIVFQDFQLLHDRSVEENLKFVLKATGWKGKKEIEAQIQKVLDLVGLGNKGYKLPHQLSGGEQQRISIARAFLNDPDLILADEPTGNLDPETSVEIMDLLMSIGRKKVGVVMATHDYRIIELFPSKIYKCANETLSELVLSR